MSLVALVAVAPLSAVASAASADEQAFLDATNADRAQGGIAALTLDPKLSAIALEWTNKMVADGKLSHRGDLVAQVEARVTTEWRSIGENVGYGGSVSQIQAAFMNSPGHRANVMNGKYNRVGIGTVRSGDRLWVTVNFLEGPDLAPQCVDNGGSSTVFHLRNTNSSGTADCSFAFGQAGSQVLACDWNGDGIDTIGTFRDGKWELRNANSSGAADLTFTYGSPGDGAVCGDWNGDGIDTVGVTRGKQFFLRNSNGGGAADVTLAYGKVGDTPVVGDWDGDGDDTFGVRRDNQFFLRNSLSSGVADLTLAYGKATDTPIVGNFDGKGGDSFGVRRGNAYYLRNDLRTGVAHLTFAYGAAGDLPIVGDWNGDGTDTVGIAR